LIDERGRLMFISKLSFPKVLFISAFVICCILLAARQKITGGLAGGDSIIYYSYLRSIVIDRDLNFENEYSFFAGQTSKFSGYSKLHSQPPRDESGRYPMKQPIGTIISWIPFFILGHLIAFATFLFTNDHSLLNGFTQIEYYLTSVSSIFYSFAAFYLIYKFILRFISTKETTALIASFLAAMATPITYYILFLPTYSHAVSLFWCSAFTVHFITGWEDAKLGKMFFVISGFLYGMAVSTRFQDIALVVIPAVFILADLFRGKVRFTGKVPKMILFLLVFLIALSPQLYVNYYLHGSLLKLGYEEISFPFLLNPKILYTLFSVEKGLFVWTPVTALALIGIFLIKDQRTVIAMISFFMIELYAISAYYYFNQGDSFSIRMLGNYAFIFAFGLSAIIDRYWERKSMIFATSIFFVILNFTLMILFAFRVLGRPYGFIWHPTVY
jgi:hypothetical protein